MRGKGFQLKVEQLKRKNNSLKGIMQSDERKFKVEGSPEKTS